MLHNHALSSRVPCDRCVVLELGHVKWRMCSSHLLWTSGSYARSLRRESIQPGDWVKNHEGKAGRNKDLPWQHDRWSRYTSVTMPYWRLHILSSSNEEGDTSWRTATTFKCSFCRLIAYILYWAWPLTNARSHWMWQPSMLHKVPRNPCGRAACRTRLYFKVPISLIWHSRYYQAFRIYKEILSLMWWAGVQFSFLGT